MSLIDPSTIAMLAGLGLVAGFLAGLLGIGGGMILVPFMSYLLGRQSVEPELAIKMAIATSMATIMFTSASSVRAHHRRGAVRWDIVWRLAPGIVLGGLVASLGIFAVLKGSYLGMFFGLFVGYSALRMFFKSETQRTRDMPGTLGQLGAGGVIGCLSGLLGAGGAFISVPFMTWCRVPIHNAVATSAALGFPIAVTNVLGFLAAGLHLQGLPPGAIGYIWLPGLVSVAVCSVLTAPLGAKAAHQLPVAKLKQVFACLLLALASYMLYKSAMGLVH
ncbi:MAG: sulfite exporter TauE/SafE family protein [Comamonas sp.]